MLRCIKISTTFRIGDLRTALRLGAFWLLATVACASMPSRTAHAQSLIDMYRSARFQTQAERILSNGGARAVPRSVERVPYVSDSVRARVGRLLRAPDPAPEPPAPLLEVSEWRLIPKLGRSWYEKNFGAEGWSFLGNGSMTRLDTTFTREIRARLESEFGSPTQTIADLENFEDRPIGDYIQFEYWFVLNDTIAMRVIDVNGPLERGVVVATEQKYRKLLPELRDKLEARLTGRGKRSPYVDYYYLPDQRMWFVTGFDGRRYFMNRISKPNLRLGRPVLEKVLDS